MWNWCIDASVEVWAEPERVWKLWADVSSWPDWDHELEWSCLEGPFVQGAKGKIKPRQWPVSEFQLVHVNSPYAFIDEASLLFTKLYFEHRLIKLNAKEIMITHRVQVKGLLAPLLRFTLGRKLKHALPKAVQSLANLVEVPS